MNPWLLVAALVVGIAAGIGATLLARRLRAREASGPDAPAIPEGIDAVLDAIELPAVLVAPTDGAVEASGTAVGSGIVNAYGEVHPDVLALVGRVRAEHAQIVNDLAIGRSGVGDTLRHLRTSAAPIGDGFVLVIAEDRTEAVRLDEVRRDFVANVSHELKTPIGAVSLLAEAIESASDDPAQVRRFAGRLSTEAQRLANLTQDIIELSRVQGAEARLHTDLVRIDAVVSAALDNNRVAADVKGITIVGGGQIGLAVHGHQPTLVTALHNLIANAVQYSPDRSRIGVGVTHRGDTVEIAVTDQGQGIKTEEQERIFERFFRSDPARSRNTGGTGLGLAIVKHAVQNHGGEIRVWSQFGRGSTFTICLPLADLGEPPADPTETAPLLVATQTPEGVGA